MPLEEQPKQLATGICGSGIIEVIAEMLLQGVILPDGRFNPALTSDRVYQSDGSGSTKTAQGRLSPGNRRANQHRRADPGDPGGRAGSPACKGPLYAGAKLLMNRAGVQTVNCILLAGAFGSYIDPMYAMVLGLVPDCDLQQGGGGRQRGW